MNEEMLDNPGETGMFGFKDSQMSDKRCERCIVRSLNCNGKVPVCNKCARYAALKKLTNINCVYKQDMDQHSYTTDDKKFDDLLSVDSSVQLNENDILNIDDDLKEHLFSLTILNTHFYSCCADDLIHLLQPDRFAKMGDNMKRSLLLPSLMYSTHPKLFPHLKSLKMEERIEYCKKITIPLEIDPDQLRLESVYHQCDEIRSRLGIGIFLIRTGDRDKGKMVIQSTFALARELSFFDTKINELSKEKRQSVSVDDLVKMASSLHMAENQSGYSDQEQVEIYSLIGFLYSTNNIMLPVGMVPLSFHENVLLKIDISYPSVPIIPIRQLIPDLAKHTIWEKTHWAPMFDEMKEIHKSFPRSSNDYGKMIKMSITLGSYMRRAVLFARRDKYDTNFNIVEEKMKLHNQVLKILADIPKERSYFDSLSCFIYGADTATLRPPQVKCDTRALGLTYVVLIMMSYLHLTGAQENDQMLFPSYYGGPPLFLSKDILCAAGKAMAFIVKIISTPFNPNESFFGPYPYPPHQIEECLYNPMNDKLPAPLFADPSSLFAFSMICYSSYIGGKCLPYNKEQEKDLHQALQETLLPAMDRIAYLWPPLTSPSKSLRDLMNGRHFENGSV